MSTRAHKTLVRKAARADHRRRGRERSDWLYFLAASAMPVPSVGADGRTFVYAPGPLRYPAYYNPLAGGLVSLGGD